MIVVANSQIVDGNSSSNKAILQCRRGRGRGGEEGVGGQEQGGREPKGEKLARRRTVRGGEGEKDCIGAERERGNLAGATPPHRGNSIHQQNLMPTTKFRPK